MCRNIHGPKGSFASLQFGPLLFPSSTQLNRVVSRVCGRRGSAEEISVFMEFSSFQSQGRAGVRLQKFVSGETEEFAKGTVGFEKRKNEGKRASVCQGSFVFPVCHSFCSTPHVLTTCGQLSSLHSDCACLSASFIPCSC